MVWSAYEVNLVVFIDFKWQCWNTAILHVEKEHEKREEKNGKRVKKQTVKEFEKGKLLRSLDFQLIELALSSFLEILLLLQVLYYFWSSFDSF